MALDRFRSGSSSGVSVTRMILFSANRYPAERSSSSSEWSTLDEQFLASSSSSSEDEAERLYATHDQWHVTSIINRTGAVQERYAYRGYGQSIVLSPAFAARAASHFDWETRYGAYRFDAESGLYQVRYRYLHPGLGRWISADLLKEAVGPSLYQYVGNSAANAVDVTGLSPAWQLTGPLAPPLPKYEAGPEACEMAVTIAAAAATVAGGAAALAAEPAKKALWGLTLRLCMSSDMNDDTRPGNRGKRKPTFPTVSEMKMPEYPKPKAKPVPTPPPK
jgi:RHS repeat-associated protein